MQCKSCKSHFCSGKTNSWSALNEHETKYNASDEPPEEDDVEPDKKQLNTIKSKVN